MEISSTEITNIVISTLKKINFKDKDFKKILGDRIRQYLNEIRETQ